MYAPPCSWRTGTNSIEELASDSLRSSVSSPGMPKTRWTPSASRHSTKTSDALRGVKSFLLFDVFWWAHSSACPALRLVSERTYSSSQLRSSGPSFLAVRRSPGSTQETEWHRHSGGVGQLVAEPPNHHRHRTTARALTQPGGLCGGRHFHIGTSIYWRSIFWVAFASHSTNLLKC